MPRSRGARWGLRALFVLAPAIVTPVLLWVLFNATLLDYFPRESDELAYCQQIAAFVRAGFESGYFGFYEVPARLAASHFSAHGPAFPVLYGLIGRIVGWHPSYGPPFNLAVLGASSAIFLAMTSLSPTRIVVATVVLLTSWWVLLMLPTTMQETVNHAFMIVIAAFVVRLLDPDARRRDTLLTVALIVVAIASVLRPTNWIVAVPLVFVALARRSPRVIALAVAAAAAGIPVFWLIWRYVSAPIPGLRIELGLLSGDRIGTNVWNYFLDQISDNVVVFDPASFLADPFPEHIMFESLALTVIFAVLVATALIRAARARRAGITVDAVRNAAFNLDVFTLLTLGLSLVAFVGFYFDFSISRVAAPFLLLSLLVMAATGHRPWILAATVIVSLLVAPSFLATYRASRQDLFNYDQDDRARFERFRGEITKYVAYDANQGPWCNTLLTMTYPREIIAVPAGIGLSNGSPPEAVKDPIKSKYLLLTGDGTAAYKARAHLQPLATTEFGDLYRNLDARCH